MIDSQTFIVLVSVAACVLAAMMVLLRMAHEKSRLVERYEYLKAALERNDRLKEEARRKREAYQRGQEQLARQDESAETDQIEEPTVGATTTAESAG